MQCICYFNHNHWKLSSQMASKGLWTATQCVLKQDRQYIYIYIYIYIICNNKAYSCNHCCSGKAISITYPESMLVALGIQHARHMCHIVICGLSGCIMFFHIILSHRWHNVKKKSYWTQSVCSDPSSGRQVDPCGQRDEHMDRWRDIMLFTNLLACLKKGVIMLRT